MAKKQAKAADAEGVAITKTRLCRVNAKYEVSLQFAVDDNLSREQAEQAGLAKIQQTIQGAEASCQGLSFSRMEHELLDPKGKK